MSNDFPFPFCFSSDTWSLALETIPYGWNEIRANEKKIFEIYAKRHSLFTLTDRESLRKVVVMFQAKVLLCLKENVSTEDVETEYHSIQLMLFRQSGYDMTLRLQIDELLIDEISMLMATIVELVAISRSISQ